ncbi:MAG: type I-E CRISPR-associated protein Cse2/CasB [Verrucomicrobiales bacterium]
MKTPEIKQDEPFIQRLLNACGGEKAGRTQRAMLRRYWSTTTRHYAYPILGQLGVAKPETAEATIAALYATHPQHSPSAYKVGGAALQLGERKKDDLHPYDAHFRRLLAAEEADDVAWQLFRLMRRLSRFSERVIVVNYNSLLWDLRKWQRDSDDIKTQWALEFWRAVPSTTNQG